MPDSPPPAQEFASHILGVPPDEIVAVGTRLSPLPFLIATHALSHDLPGDTSTAPASPRHEAAAAYLPPLEGTDRLIPYDGLFVLPAGTAADVPLVIRCTSPGLGDRVLEVLCRRGDLAIASAYLSFLHHEGAVQRHPYRGLVCEVHPDRSQMRTAIRFEPVELAGAARGDLVVDQDVWDAVDENVHGMFRSASVLKAADLGVRRGLLIAG